MKRLFTTTIFALVVLSFQLTAQIKTPAASPAASFTQMVGLTKVSAEYSRPSVKGRTVFAADGLVPFGKIWRTGANGISKLTFSDDVTIEGQTLAKGSYGVLTVPSASSWDVMFYKYDKGSWSSYREKEADLKVSVTPVTTPFKVESFLITVADIKADGALLEILWDNTLVPLKLSVGTDATVMANIDKVMAGPSAGDYYNAGMYMYNAGKDKMKALEYVQKGIAMGGEPKFWQKKWEAEILASVGKKKDAIKAAKHSMELAEKAGNADYVKMNKDNLAKWK